MLISVIIITYFSEKELPALLDSLVSQQELEEFELEIIIINNGGNIPSITAFDLDIQVHHQSQNWGYAKAINLGVNYSQGDFFIFMNPDISLRSDCISQLIKGLKQFDVTGPFCYLDQGYSILLPATERTDYVYRLVKSLATRYQRMAKRLHNIWLKENAHSITAKKPFLNFQLSGAMLATSRKAWEQIGPFDEGFRLYYEENDWLKRAKNKSLKAGQVPAARIHHSFNQSAKREPQAQAWFQDSAAYFLRKHYHPILNSIIQKLSSSTRKDVFPFQPYHIRNKETDSTPFIPVSFILPTDTSTSVIEISLSPLFVPSALMLVKKTETFHWELPIEVWDNFQEGKYYFRVIDHF